jgi:hypothetical protein
VRERIDGVQLMMKLRMQSPANVNVLGLKHMEGLLLDLDMWKY